MNRVHRRPGVFEIGAAHVEIARVLSRIGLLDDWVSRYTHLCPDPGFLHDPGPGWLAGSLWEKRYPSFPEDVVECQSLSGYFNINSLSGSCPVATHESFDKLSEAEDRDGAVCCQEISTEQSYSLPCLFVCYGNA